MGLSKWKCKYRGKAGCWLIQKINDTNQPSLHSAVRSATFILKCHRMATVAILWQQMITVVRP